MSARTAISMRLNGSQPTNDVNVSISDRASGIGPRFRAIVAQGPRPLSDPRATLGCMSIDFEHVTLSEAYELTGVGTPPVGHGADLDPDNPACPRCQSQMRRCVDADGNKVWPWHTERQVVFSRTLLSDAGWVAYGPAAAVAQARALVEAYELGRQHG